MKFKEFHIFTGNKHLNEAIRKHAKTIGYVLYGVTPENMCCMNFYLGGEFTSCNDQDLIRGENLTLEQFFKLTPRDVQHMIEKMVQERES